MVGDHDSLGDGDQIKPGRSESGNPAQFLPRESCDPAHFSTLARIRTTVLPLVPHDTKESRAIACPRSTPSMPSIASLAMTVLTFGAKLDLIRRALGLTRAEFAVKCGIKERTMDRLLAGENAPSARNLFLIVTRAGISLDAFGPEDFTEEGPP